MLSFILQIGNTVVAAAVETLAAQPVTTGIETVTELPPNHLSLFEMVSTVCASLESIRKIIVAGEMLELGPAGPEHHREAGRQIARLGVDRLIGIRGLAEEIVAGAREAGMAVEAATFANTPDEAADILIREARKGDLILVKGSRGVKTETVVERMKQKFGTLPGCGETMTGDAAIGRC